MSRRKLTAGKSGGSIVATKCFFKQDEKENWEQASFVQGVFFFYVQTFILETFL
jgi:hypothetical protein